MSGMKSTIAQYLLNLLTCNCTELWPFVNSSTADIIYLIASKHQGLTDKVNVTSVQGTASSVSSYYHWIYDEEQKVADLKSGWDIATIYPSLVVSEYIETTEGTAINTWTGKVSMTNPSLTSSYLGLLYDQPHYYAGATSVSGLENKYPAKKLTAIESGSLVADSYTAFLNVPEIPNTDHNGFLKTPSSENIDASKPNNGFYWDGYQRIKLGSLNRSSSSEPYAIQDNQMTGAQIISTDIILDDTSFYTKQTLVNSNKRGLFLGENDTDYAWPAVKYFGLFKQSISSSLWACDIDGNYYFKEVDDNPDLYLWGELNETNDWYHLTTDTIQDTSKTYYINTGTTSQPVYTEWDGSTTWDKTKMYEKLGIVVNPNEGAVFSTGAFKLQFEDETYTNVVEED